MSRAITIDNDIFIIRNVYSPTECADLIRRAESIGFDAASVRTRSGPKMMTQLRNNDRVNLSDQTLASQMWNRVSPDLPTLDGVPPVSVDPSIRFYRYLPGQQFRRHKDGSVFNSKGQRSKLSYLIYLNDDCKGGDTLFRERRQSEGGQFERWEYSVEPRVGTALLFRHQRWHEGMPVTAGRKYVLRSDIFYDSEI